MFNNARIRNSLIALGLSLPLMSTAMADGFVLPMQKPSLCRIPSANGLGSSICDFSLTFQPTNFSNICLGDVIYGIYTIQNNTPTAVLLNYIRIQTLDSMPAASSAILVASSDNCVAGTSLAAGASCNILVRLTGLQTSTFNRTLQVGIDTRQVELDATPITATVGAAGTCPAPTPTPTPTPTPAPSPSPTPVPPEASPYILGASTVTSTGLTVVNGGDVDVSPGTAITGFSGVQSGGSGTIINGGTAHAADATANTAHANAVTAFNAEQSLGLTCLATPFPANPNNLTDQDLGGKTLTPGTYCFSSSAGLTGNLTLSGHGTYVFYTGSTLTTASAATVTLIGGALNSDVNWAIGSSATFGTNSQMVGTVDASASITLTNGASLQGRAWALNGAVTMDTNLINPN